MASYHLFLLSLKYLLVDTGRKWMGMCSCFLCQTISITILHLIFKMLLFFRYRTLSYVKQMVKYQFWVNLVHCAIELIVSRSSQQGITVFIVLYKNKQTKWVWGQLIFFSIIAAQALKEDFPLSHVISPFTNQERREGMLLNLLIPFVLTVGSGSKGLINLTKGNVSLLYFL